MTFLNGVHASPEFWGEVTAQLTDWQVRIEASPQLQDTGHGQARLAVRQHSRVYDAVVMPAAQAKHLPASGAALGTPLLLISDKITTKTGSMLRRAGIDYVDSCGGASIAFDEVVVALSGTGTPRTPLKSGRTGASGAPTTNLYSAGRAQVLAVLLSWPEFLDKPVRQIAQVAGTSVGLVHDVLSALESLGYIDRLARTSHLTDIHGLALNWAAAFPGGLRRKMEIGVFYSDPHRWPVASSDALLGGEWAVRDLLQPARVTVYAPQIDGPLLSGLRLRTAEQGEANTIVLRRFWQSPTPDQRHSIPWVVTYAELMSSQDARVRTAGHDFFRLHAG